MDFRHHTPGPQGSTALTRFDLWPPERFAPGKELLRTWKWTLRADPCSFCGARDPRPLPTCQHESRHTVGPTPLGTVDHITPHSDGGGRSSQNLAGACRECNDEKSSCTILGFLLSGGMGKGLTP